MARSTSTMCRRRRYVDKTKWWYVGTSSDTLTLLSLVQIKFSQWVFHTARINAIQFSPDGTQAVSASLDTNVYVWSTIKPMKSIAIKNAFPGGAHGACWIDDDRIASAGADGTVKVVSEDKGRENKYPAIYILSSGSTPSQERRHREGYVVQQYKVVDTIQASGGNLFV